MKEFIEEEKMIDESREKEALMIWVLFIVAFYYYRPVLQ
jgi:hypothetical protein